MKTAIMTSYSLSKSKTRIWNDMYSELRAQ